MRGNCGEREGQGERGRGRARERLCALRIHTGCFLVLADTLRYFFCVHAFMG